MKRLLLALPLLLAAGCETAPTPYAPVQSVRYQAIGGGPFWLLTIGDDRIVLRTANEGERVWPRTLPMEDGNVTRWQSSGDAGTIVIDVRWTPTPCESGNQAFEHVVRVTVGEEMLDGCGGPPVRQLSG